MGKERRWGSGEEGQGVNGYGFRLQGFIGWDGSSERASGKGSSR